MTITSTLLISLFAHSQILFVETLWMLLIGTVLGTEVTFSALKQNAVMGQWEKHIAWCPVSDKCYEEKVSKENTGVKRERADLVAGDII